VYKTDILRRSILAIPANSQEWVTEAAKSNADEVFFDLEDSLAPSEKSTARASIIEAIKKHDWGEAVLSYRINGTDTRWWYGDIIEPISEIGSKVDTIVVPKVSCASDLRTVVTLVESVEQTAGLPPGEIGLSAQIETATGMNAVIEIAQETNRLTALIFGPADYAASLGSTGGADNYPGNYWHYPLSRIAHAAASVNIQSIGGTFTGDDITEFREACVAERAMGYDGKVVVTSEQVVEANSVFAPDPEEVQRAKQIVDRYREVGSTEMITIDGNIIDKEMYQTAKRILSKAERADMI